MLKVYNDPTAMLNAVKGKQLNGAKLINNDFIDQIKGAGYTPEPRSSRTGPACCCSTATAR